MVKDPEERNPPRVLKQETVAKSRLFTVESIDLQFSNGVFRKYERLVSPSEGAVLVIPMLNNGDLILVKEYAAGTARYELGFPKGLIEQGETPTQAADRELKEEIGYGAEQFQTLKALSSSPAYFGLMVDLILARDLYPEKRDGDEPEPLELEMWPISNVDALLEREDFSEARSIASIYLLKQFLQGEKYGE